MEGGLGEWEELGCLLPVCSSQSYHPDKSLPFSIFKNKGSEEWVRVRLIDFSPPEENIKHSYKVQPQLRSGFAPLRQEHSTDFWCVPERRKEKKSSWIGWLKTVSALRWKRSRGEEMVKTRAGFSEEERLQIDWEKWADFGWSKGRDDILVWRRVPT